MLFPTLEFACFFLVVFYIYWMLNQRDQERKVFLLISSYFFYGTWDPQFMVLLVGSSLCNYGLGFMIESLRRHSVLVRFTLGLGICLNLSLLGVFKYYNFFATSLAVVLSKFGLKLDLPLLSLVLPLGISFYTFQGISYIVDVYSEKISARQSVIDVLLFVAFFPHLLAGPIVRASELLPQFRKISQVQKIDLTRPLLLIAFGLFKKMVLANYLGVDVVDHAFEAPRSLSSSDALFGAYAYAIYIYCDFSAYSDMAIGFAALLGIQFPKNFDQPYRSQSLQEFWRRWHISLSSWLRDYLFIPLGGSKEGSAKTYRNLMVTSSVKEIRRYQ